MLLAVPGSKVNIILLMLQAAVVLSMSQVVVPPGIVGVIPAPAGQGLTILRRVR